MSGLRTKVMGGVLISTPIDSDKVTIQQTRQCGHCARVWLYRPGSGNRRGFCTKCCLLTCGTPACDVCVHHERLLENMEAGMPYEIARTFNPIIVSVPGRVPEKG